ncbi:MAG TPA: hypothetical protein VGP44_12825 [Gemmatimonadales bacterium]|nr:hypothetical protein [Gemmatimonadales bacterium]
MIEGLALVIVKRCACPERGLPIRVMPAFVEWIKRLPEPPPDDLEVESYRCHRCKTLVILTAGDMHLAA